MTLASVDEVISAIVVLMTLAAVFLVSGKASTAVITDHGPETQLVALGIRNNMLSLYSSNAGRTMYATPSGEKYEISVSPEKVSVVYNDFVARKEYAPTVELYHNMPKIAEKTLVSNNFCIVKKYDGSCTSFIELCDIEDSACCKVSVCGV